MLQLREILRQKLALGRSHREVASALGISASSVSGVVVMARAHGLDMGQVEALHDDELQELLYPRPTKAPVRTEPDCAALHVELRRPGVTLALLHVEYLAAHPDGLRYTAFCERYRAWAKRRSPVMRQVHVGGDKLFVDYAGMQPRLVRPTTGEVTEVELFVAVLGASNYTFTEKRASFEPVPNLPRADGFHVGEPAACILWDGDIWCWGGYTRPGGELSAENDFAPRRESDFGDVTDVAINGTALCVLRENREFWCAGDAYNHGFCDDRTDWSLLKFESCDLPL